MPNSTNWFVTPIPLWILIVCVAGGGCERNSPTETGRFVVLSRLGDPGAHDLPSPLRANRTELGNENRSAVKVAPGVSFEVEVDGRVSRVLYAIAARDPRQASGVEFEIEVETESGWGLLSSMPIDDDEVGWQDHSIELEGSSDTKRKLRFTASAGGKGTPRSVDLFWGSVAFAAREARLGEGGAERLADPPNVILLSLDTLGAAYLGFFDEAPGASPRIESFLGDAFAFRRAFAQYPNTLVSHASLFSALYPVHHGIYSGGKKRLNSLVATLAQHGYTTAAFSENGFVSSHFGFANGFDRYSNGRTLERFAGDADQTFEDATHWLSTYGRDARFFLFVHTYEVHAPYHPRDEEALATTRRITPNNERLFSEKTLSDHNFGRRRLNDVGLERLRALYVGEIQYLDRLVGEFLTTLEALGLERDTLVILTSDHGEQFGEGGKVGHGHNLHNRSLHVPLGFRWPGGFEANESRAPVQLVDVMPTVLELAGIEPPGGLDGRSLASTLRGETEGEVERPAFSELISSGSECFIRTGSESCRLGRFAVQTERFKLITSEIPRRTRLYDLDADPLETRDVSRKFPDEVARHEALIARYLETSSAQPHAVEHDTPDLGPELRERLKTLGYIQ